jgi:hypothetical protein
MTFGLEISAIHIVEHAQRYIDGAIAAAKLARATL